MSAHDDWLLGTARRKQIGKAFASQMPPAAHFSSVNQDYRYLYICTTSVVKISLGFEQGGQVVTVAKKVVLVTGANRGIGVEIARQLASRGLHVVAAGRDLSAVRKTVEAMVQA